MGDDGACEQRGYQGHGGKANAHNCFSDWYFTVCAARIRAHLHCQRRLFDACAGVTVIVAKLFYRPTMGSIRAARVTTA
jgi:hypothetical protein